MARVVGGACTPQLLKQNTLRCLQGSLAYLHEDIFNQLEEYPLCLTQGNIADNLVKLKEILPASVTNPTARKICYLARAEYPLPPIVEALTFARDELLGTTELVEKGHGSGACIKKNHSMYSEETLQWRCLHHQARALVVKSPDDKRLDILQKEVQKRER